MKFAIIGAGAIGSFVGASLQRAGHEVTLVARGPHLIALRERGIAVQSPRGSFSARPANTEDITSVGPVDAVLLALKAHQIRAVAGDIHHLFGPSTVVVAMQNGIPWWYFQRHGGTHDGLVLQSVDPGGEIAAAIPPERVLGCVIYSSAALAGPGVVHHFEGVRYLIGEPDRTISERALGVAQALADADLTAPVVPDIRRDIWTKLLGNAAFNPISALTRASLASMTNDPFVEPVVREMMQETIAVAGRLGIAFEITIDRRIDGARSVGAHKTSMLQDLEARKPLELDALCGAVVELGELVGVQTPAARHISALTKLLEKTTLAL